MSAASAAPIATLSGFASQALSEGLGGQSPDRVVSVLDRIVTVAQVSSQAAQLGPPAHTGPLCPTPHPAPICCRFLSAAAACERAVRPPLSLKKRVQQTVGAPAHIQLTKQARPLPLQASVVPSALQLGQGSLPPATFASTYNEAALVKLIQDALQLA